MSESKPVQKGKLYTDAQGNKVIRVADVTPEVKDTQVLVTLWDVIHGGTVMQGKDGKEVVIRPVTLGTLAKLEAIQAQYGQDREPGKSLAYTIRFLTVMLNDKNNRPPESPALTEEQVADLIDAETMPLAVKLIEDVIRPLLPRSLPTTETAPEPDGAGRASSAGSLASTAGRPASLPTS